MDEQGFPAHAGGGQLIVFLPGVLTRFQNQYIRVDDPADGRYRDYSQYPYTRAHDAVGFPANNSVALHDEWKRQDWLAENARPEPTGEWAALKAEFVKQDPKEKKKAKAALEKHFKKHRPNYFRHT
jgi:hypothetical protein